MNRIKTDKVINTIKKDNITVRSRFSVLWEKLRWDGLIVGIFAVLSLVAGSFLVWMVGNRDLLSDYGTYGWRSFFQSFPYGPAIVFAGIFFLFIFFLRRFDFSYKKPFAAVTGLLLVLIIGIAWIASLHPAGKSVFNQSGRMLRMAADSGGNFLTGTVVATGSGAIKVRTAQGEEITVTFGGETRYPAGEPREGDFVRSVGEWQDKENFQAVGVRVFGDEAPRGQGAGRMRHQVNNPTVTLSPVTPTPEPTGTAGTENGNGQKRMLNRE